MRLCRQTEILFLLGMSLSVFANAETILDYEIDSSVFVLLKSDADKAKAAKIEYARLRQLEKNPGANKDAIKKLKAAQEAIWQSRMERMVPILESLRLLLVKQGKMKDEATPYRAYGQLIDDIASIKPSA